MTIQAAQYMTNRHNSFKKTYRLGEKPSNTRSKLFTAAAVAGWISFGVVVFKPTWVLEVLLNLFK
jgi:hypothetical protein